MNTEIDINFDFRSDTPPDKDPDFHSKTLRRYHKYLWSKPLPNGKFFSLNEGKYLYHKSDLGEFFLSSDAITHSYRKVKRMSHIVSEIPHEVVSFLSFGCTIGAYTLFPSNRVDGKPTINGARGMNHKIGDRFDITLECIRLYYEGKDSPLSATFKRYDDFFSLFEGFSGYVNFFLFQDLVAENYSTVKFHLPFNDFDRSPLPSDINEYLQYKENTIKFVTARSQRMLESI